MRNGMRGSVYVVGLLAAASLTACAVTTPRNGYGSGAVGANQGSAAGSVAAGTADGGSGAAPLASGGAPGATTVTGTAGSQVTGGAAAGPLPVGGGGLAARSGGASTTTSSKGTSTAKAIAGRSTTSGKKSATGGKSSGTASSSVAAANAKAPPAVGVTPTSITIEYICDCSGLYGTFFQEFRTDGVGTWVNQVNANGGINGRQIVLKSTDSMSSADGGVAACKQTQADNAVLAFATFGLTGSDTAEADCLNRAGIPFIINELSAYDQSWSNVYTSTPVGGYSTYLPDILASRYHDTTQQHVGVIYGNDALNIAKRNAFVAAVQARGGKVVADEPVDDGGSTFTTQISDMKSKGVTSAAFFGGIEIIGILRDSSALDFHPNWTGTDWDADGSTPNENGFYSYRWWATADSQAYADYQNAVSQYDSDSNTKSQISTTTASYYGISELVGQIIKNMGSTPSRGAVGAAIGAIVNYNNGMMATSFGRGVHLATPSVFPIKCCNSTATAWLADGAPATKF